MKLHCKNIICLWRACIRVLLISGLIAGAVAAQPQATLVGVDEVRMEPMLQTVPILGRFVSPQSGVIAARAAGPIASFEVDVGDHVQKGQIIAELDQDRLQTRLLLQEAELTALEASQKTAEAREQYASQELSRIRKLRKSAAFSQYDYDKRLQEFEVARSSREEAQARIAQGQINKKLAEIELRDSLIRAPFPGVVSERHSSEGAWLQVGDPVVTLINDTLLEVEADVPSERLRGIRPGSQMTALLDNSIRFEVTVRAIIPDENPSARTRPVRLVPQLQDLDSYSLAINQPVTLLMPASGEVEVLSVAKDAIIRRGQNAIVFLVVDGEAQPRPVQLGEAIGSRFQVLDGLNSGDVVVIRGNERLRPGQAVSYPGQPVAKMPQEPAAETAQPQNKNADQQAES